MQVESLAGLSGKSTVPTDTGKTDNMSVKKLRNAMIAAKLPTQSLRSVYRRITRAPNLGSRSLNILFALEYIRQNSIRGRSKLEQVAEFGTAAGEGLRQLYILIKYFTEMHNLEMPKVYGFDSFEGLPPSEHMADIGTWSDGDYPGSFRELQDFISSIGWEDNCTLVRGLFSETLQSNTDVNPDFLLIDCDYYTSTFDVFESLKDRLNSGAIVYFDDLGTNHFNRNMGEERLIYEVQTGELGAPYHLHHIYDKCYVWSNAAKPVRKSSDARLEIKLKKTGSFDDFY